MKFKTLLATILCFKQQNTNRKVLFTALLLFFIIFNFSNSQAQSAVEKHGQLQVKGNKVVDKNDAPVQLKGMSLFWSQEIGKYYN